MKAADRLNSLLGSRLTADARTHPRAEGVVSAQGVMLIAAHRIKPDPNQPRREFDESELLQLAKSLKAHGQLQPIRVRWCDATSAYVVIAGERRLRAAALAGIQTLTAVVDEAERTAEELTVVQLVENAVRADLSPIEAAHAFKALLTALECTQADLAERLCISQSKVSRTLALLELPDQQRQEVEQGKRGAAASVMQARRRTPTQAITISTPSGSVVVKPKPGQTVESVLVAALKERKAAA